MCKNHHFNEDSGALLVHRSEHPGHDDNICAEVPALLVRLRCTWGCGIVMTRCACHCDVRFIPQVLRPVLRENLSAQERLG